MFVVAIVLTIIDRFSPSGHHALALSTGEGTGDEFSLYNSVWFATGSMLGQGGDNTPRSGSGRILVASFWLFILIMISTYTANLAAYFTGIYLKIFQLSMLKLLISNSLAKIQRQLFLMGENKTFYINI